MANVEHTYYLFGTAAGPHPFPAMVRDFARIIGVEARRQSVEMTGGLPDAVCACVGGGSNAIGVFHAFVPDEAVRLYGFEAGGSGVASGLHAASITGGSVGVLHGTRTYILQDEYGQTKESHSISAGLDYPGVGPEHAWLHATGRAVYEPVDDAEAMAAFRLLCRTEGIIPAIESAHALAGALRIVPELRAELGREPVIVVNLSGRGDKDMHTAASYFGLEGGDREQPLDGAERVPKREPRRPDRLPPSRLPLRRRLHRRDAGHGRRGLRHHRGRPAVFGPGDGRPGHPGGRHKALEAA